MEIVIENSQKNVFKTQNKKDPSLNWHIVTQDALLFKSNEKYPDKIQLTLTVTANENQANAINPFDAGTYVLTENAFGSDRNGRPTCDFSKIVMKKS